MPFTPFHFGLNACATYPVRRRVDLLVFVLASVAVDVEPLLVMVFGLDYPLHGYAHTFVFEAMVGLVWGWAMWSGRGILIPLLGALEITYRPRLKKVLVSGVLGAWAHVLLDAPLYWDIRPFYPLTANPLYGLLTQGQVHAVCLVAFIPAYILLRREPLEL